MLARAFRYATKALAVLSALSVLSVPSVASAEGSSVGLPTACPVGCTLPAYYVSADGSDLNDGLSVATPFRSIGKVNRVLSDASFVPIGLPDVLSYIPSFYFRAGDTFIGQVEASRPSSFSTYWSSGVAANVTAKISGCVPLPIAPATTSIASSPADSLTKTSVKNVYAIKLSGLNVSSVYVNGQRGVLARQPNRVDGKNGYYHATQVSSDGTVFTIDQSLPAPFESPRWPSTEPGKQSPGVRARVRTTSWSNYPIQVLSGSGVTVYLNDSFYKGYEVTGFKSDFGFFLEDHESFLDDNYEYLVRNDVLYVYLNKPATSLCGISFNHNVRISSSGVAVSNLTLTGAGLDNVYAFNGTNKNALLTDVSVVGCAIDGSYRAGVFLDGNTVGAYVVDNALTDHAAGGLFVKNGTGLVVRGNRLTGIGVSEGQGYMQKGQSHLGPFGIYGVGIDSVVDSNSLDRIGNSGIQMKGINLSITNNTIKNCMLALSDGGGIYTAGSNYKYGGIVMSGNRVSDCYGNGDSAPKRAFSAHGIYLDSTANNVLIVKNNLKRFSTTAINLSGAANVTIADCYMEACGVNCFRLIDPASNVTLSQTKILNLVGTTAGATVSNGLISTINTALLGRTDVLLSNNRYCSDVALSFRAGDRYVNFTGWQTYVNDVGSTFSNRAC